MFIILKMVSEILSEISTNFAIDFDGPKVLLLAIRSHTPRRSAELRVIITDCVIRLAGHATSKENHVLPFSSFNFKIRYFPKGRVNLNECILIINV